MSLIQEELFSEFARELSYDIQEIVDDEEVTLDEIMAAVLPRGAPGAQFHRPLLRKSLTALMEEDEPLDLVTCLQICHAFDWPIGILED